MKKLIPLIVGLLFVFTFESCFTWGFSAYVVETNEWVSMGLAKNHVEGLQTECFLHAGDVLGIPEVNGTGEGRGGYPWSRELKSYAKGAERQSLSCNLGTMVVVRTISGDRVPWYVTGMVVDEEKEVTLARKVDSGRKCRLYPGDLLGSFHQVMIGNNPSSDMTGPGRTVLSLTSEMDRHNGCQYGQKVLSSTL